MRRLRRILLDLRFLEIDVLARHRIVLLERELLGRGPGILLGHVVVAGVGRAHQLDQNRALLGHGPASPPTELRRRAQYSPRPRCQAPLPADGAKPLFDLRKPQVTGQGLACQISAAYCLIVRSLENLPEPATLRMAFFAQARRSA